MLLASEDISDGSGGSSAAPVSKKKQRRARQWSWGSTLCQRETLSKQNQGRVKHCQLFAFFFPDSMALSYFLLLSLGFVS